MGLVLEGEVWVTRTAALTAAGVGVEVLVDALARGVPLTRPAPWAWPGLPPVASVKAGGRAVAEEMLERVVDEVDPGVRCGLVVGTTSGAIAGFEAVFPDGGRHEWRQRPAVSVGARCARRWAGRAGAGDEVAGPVTTVSVACASGAAAFDVARGWLRSGRCERVIVAGVDALSPFIHAGFAGIGALAAGPSRPFTAGRDGLMLGEGAAAVLLETPESAIGAGRSPICALLGTGLSQDAVHLTAPDRTGDGLFRAIVAALGDAGIGAADAVDAIGLVSAHGTGTPFNDAMEAAALARVFGAAPVPLHAAKPVVGHTLGAAGTVEAVALIAMLAGAAAPSPVNADPALGMCAGPRCPGPYALSINAAFGGVNTALVFGPPTLPSPTKPQNLPQLQRPFVVHPAPFSSAATPERVDVEGESFPVADLPRLADGSVAVGLGRADNYVRAGILALARIGARPDEAIVLASEEGCAQADRRYLEGLRANGPERASRVQFVYTIPGAPLAEAAILLGLKGPALVLCDDEAAGHAEAARLVSEGRVASAIAVTVASPRGGSGVTTASATRHR